MGQTLLEYPTEGAKGCSWALQYGAIIVTVTHDVAVAESGNARVLGVPWQRWEPGGGSEILLRYMAADDVDQYMKKGCTLTDDEQQMLLSVHEVGHSFAMHAVGMDYGEIGINPESPESRDGRTDLQRFGRAEWRELPRTAREAAMLALGGWVATETWLDLTFVSARKLRDDKLNVCHAQIKAADDHYSLMCFPTPRLTAYLYGEVQPPEDWKGDVIVIETLARDMTAMFRSRWPRVTELAETVVRARGATVGTITEALGEPGWAR